MRIGPRFKVRCSNIVSTSEHEMINFIHQKVEKKKKTH